MPLELSDHPRDRIAFGVAGGERRTYGELDERSARVAGWLRAQGLTPGDVVAVLVANRVEWAELAWGGLRSGLRVAPLSTHLTRGELARLLETARPGALISDQPLDGLPLPAAVLRPGDHIDAAPLPPAEDRLGARLVFSGGTTGLPKAIREPLPEGDPPPIRLAPLLEQMGIGPQSTVLSPSPCYHSAPFGYMSTVHRLGGTALTMERFDAAGCLEAVREHGVTHLHVVPTMLVRLLRLPPRARAGVPLEGLILGGGACAPETKRAALAWLGPIVHEYYGASEGYGQTYAAPADALARPGTVGRPVRGTLHVTGSDGAELPAGQDGRVWFGGTPPVSYDGDPERTAAARDPRGWSTVGDVGHLDADGFLYLTGREGLTIITGGVNVQPQEIEDVLLAHPAVQDAAVFGVPDPEWGEAVVALVEASPAVTDALREHCRAHLSPPKRPRVLRTDVAIPRTPAGKLRVADARTAYLEACTR